MVEVRVAITGNFPLQALHNSRLSRRRRSCEVKLPDANGGVEVWRAFWALDCGEGSVFVEERRRLGARRIVGAIDIAVAVVEANVGTAWIRGENLSRHIRPSEKY